MKRRLLGLVLGAGAAMLAAGCNPSGIDPDADVTITGKLVQPDGSPAEGYVVGWLKNDLISKDIYFLGLNYDTFDDYYFSSTHAEIVVTDAQGAFSFSFKGRDANTTTSKEGKEKAAYHQVMVLQDPVPVGVEPTDHNGFALILSRDPHTFTTSSGYTWDVGTLRLWDGNDAAGNQLNDTIEMTWTNLQSISGDYFVELRDSEDDIAWQQVTGQTELTLVYDAIHPSRDYQLGFVVYAETSMWEYRTSDVLIDTAGLQRWPIDVFASNNSYAVFAQLIDDSAGVTLDQMPGCETLVAGQLTIADDDLDTSCTLYDVENDIVGLYVDLFDNNQPLGDLLEDVSTLVLFNSDISSWGSACLRVYVWPNVQADWTMDLLTDNARTLAAEECGEGVLGAVWVALPLDDTYATRHLQVEVTGGSVLETVGELGLFGP